MKVDWMYVQNIIIIIAVVVIWMYTGSPWSLLMLLFLMNREKEN